MENNCNSMTRILHVIEGIQESCGISRFVVETVRELQYLGQNAAIVTTKNWNVPADDLKIYQTMTPEDAANHFQPQVIHINGCWNNYVHRMAKWCRSNHVPYILSPHGAWTQWAMNFRAWKKRVAWWLFQKADASGASGFHVTVTSETSDVRRLGFSQPVTVAPLGIRISEKMGGNPPMVSRNKVLLYLGRLHRKKNIHRLIAVWKGLPRDMRSDWKLVIAGKTGPDNPEYLTQLQELADGDCQFVGEVTGISKDMLYCQARLCILPSFSENFGVVVLEALASGTPVIATTGTPWAALKENNCGWWVEPTEADLLQALSIAMSLPDARLQEMSQSARSYVEANFSWRKSTERLLEAYEQLKH
jgi:glycosyltransferase involved in cell wall biosynthesis